MRFQFFVVALLTTYSTFITNSASAVQISRESNIYDIENNYNSMLLPQIEEAEKKEQPKKADDATKEAGKKKADDATKSKEKESTKAPEPKDKKKEE